MTRYQTNSLENAGGGTAGTAGTDKCGTAVPGPQLAVARKSGQGGTAGTAGTGIGGTAVPQLDIEYF